MLFTVVLLVLVVAALIKIRDLRRRLDELTRRLGTTHAWIAGEKLSFMINMGTSLVSSSRRTKQ